MVARTAGVLFGLRGLNETKAESSSIMRTCLLYWGWAKDSLLVLEVIAVK